MSSYRQQHARLMATRFGTGDAYAAAFRDMGHDAETVVLNARSLQSKWAVEQGLTVDAADASIVEAVFEAQLEEIRPDLLLVQEISCLSDEFLSRVSKYVGMIVGQVACKVPPRRSFDHHDFIVSSWPPLVSHFKRKGKRAEYLALGFDSGLMDSLNNSEPVLDVTVVGGLSDVHRDRLELVEFLSRHLDLAIYGYGDERLSDDARTHHRGQAWGMDMYRVISQSRITINVHGRIDVDGTWDCRYANNMRMFEATGCGTLLLTDRKANVNDFFVDGDEVVTFASHDECLDRIRHLLSNESERSSIAHAGQQRTIKDHSIRKRCETLLGMIEGYSGSKEIRYHAESV